MLIGLTQRVCHSASGQSIGMQNISRGATSIWDVVIISSYWMPNGQFPVLPSAAHQAASIYDEWLISSPSTLGAWTIHIVLICALKILFDIIPGVSQETSWTLTNITYMFGSYLMFHYVRGVPFEFNAGAYDNLNMWEQIDNGDQYTPTKKFLLSVPIVLFLLSTHYTHYETSYFTINFLAVLGVVIPKLPSVRLTYLLRFGARDL